MAAVEQRLAGEAQRESVGGMGAAFTTALAVASGGVEVEIVREGLPEVGVLSLDEMFGILATVGDARAKAEGGRASGLIGVAREPSPGMPRTLGAAAEDISAFAPFVANDAEDAGPGWVWVLVRRGHGDGEGVWVRYKAEDAPKGLEARAARPPRPGSIGVLVVHAPPAAAAEVEEFATTRPRRRTRGGPAVDRNLVTVAEFAVALDVAESTVFDWIGKGLPSRKFGGIRRVLHREAEAWLISGGLRTSRAAKKLARAAYRAATPNSGAGRGR